MFLVRRPSDTEIRVFLDRQKDKPLSCKDAGNLEPAGYTIDHNCVRLGHGSVTFQKAIDCIRRWEMFNIGWVELCWPDAPIATGSVVAVLAHHLSFWSLNACRIMSVIDDDQGCRRFGFVYGTLPDHAERGQERFLIEWRDDDSVWYDILAHSRPNAFLAKAGYPITRSLQKRFARDSMQAMVRLTPD